MSKAEMREHGRSAAAAIVQRPPHLLPQLLDPVGVLAGQISGDLARQDVVRWRRRCGRR